jgi:hypothetical protein
MYFLKKIALMCGLIVGIALYSYVLVEAIAANEMDSVASKDTPN